MKYIFREIIFLLFIFLTIGILLCNVMVAYVTTTKSSFPIIFFICLTFTAITTFVYDILILTENIVLVNRNTEIIKQNIFLSKEDRFVINLVDTMLIILNTSYLGILLYLSIQLNDINFFLTNYIIFIITIFLLRYRLNRNIKLRRVLRNNETKNKHYQPAP